MRKMKKCISFVAAAALFLTGLPVDGLGIQAQAAENTAVDSTVKLKPSDASTFNDTNGDGLGEFEGWGTSLCWWANRIGYNEELTSQAADLFFSENGLNMNIGRYNVGGGDDVAEDVTVETVPVNAKAQIYDLSDWGTNPTGAGSSMSVSTVTGLASATYAYSDADFGLTKGTTVGNLQAIGYINELGASVGSGDNLHYSVDVDEAGSYTVKLLLTLSGTNGRSVGIRVNNDSESDYTVDSATINNNVIASSGSQKLYLVTISDVDLKEGANTIDIGGVGDWTLDFVRMAVIKSGEEGTAPEEDEFLHKDHIIRSDAGVPGYAVDVTKIDLTKHDISYYTDNFARADEECGYAWNYDWDADANQINVLKAAIAASEEGGTDFIAEAFSNSPPYFMTVSGCSSGNTDSSKDNLRADSVNAFAAYMADVIKHWEDNGISFQSATAMNEPYTSYWGAYSNKQEGCHFDQGESQSRIIVALNKALKENGVNDIIISASDETSIDTAITSYNALSDDAKEIVTRIDTHTYSGSNREGLKNTAEEAGTNLWMSEVDGAYTGGTDAGEMSAAIGLAQRMMTDVNGLQSTAWILWNAIDMHADSSEYGQSWVNKGSANDYLSMEALEAAWKSTTANGYWGIAAADHDKNEIVLSMKYYAYGQFSRYIRPGYTIIGTSKTGTTLAAYDSEGKKAVIVAVNTSGSDKTWKFDLSGFENMGSRITAIRTSGTLADGEHWADVTADADIVADTENNSFTASLKENSITTYIVEGVSGILESVDEAKPAVSEIDISSDQVSGEKVWNNGTVNTPAKLVDGNFGTFFDGVNTDSGEAPYAVIDLKEETEIAAISYAPRGGYASRAVGACFYGSNDGENWTLLYEIESTPSEGVDTMAYYTDFISGKVEAYRYIKVQRDRECNFSEIGVYTLAGTIESQEAVSASTYKGSEPILPDTVEVTLDDGTTAEVPVTWDLSGIELSYDEMELYDFVPVTGTSTEANGTVTGYIICAPDNLEYLIDCMTGNSEVAYNEKGQYFTSEAWTAARGLSTLLNTETSDQAKTDDNTWGLTTESGLNVWDYGMGNDLYGFGYWAGKDVSIDYELTLPAGKHNILLGCFDFWNSRTMNVYYSVNGGAEELLCTLTSSNNQGTKAGGTIALTEESVVKISVKNGGDGDPVLSWISVAYSADAEAETVTSVGYTDGTTELPNTITVTESDGSEAEAKVIWDTSNVDFDVEPFTYVTVPGTVQGYINVTAEASVMIVPAGLQYMIDCANTDSETWALLAEHSSTMRNRDAADQAKTKDNTWGYTSTVGTTNNDGNDMAKFSQSSTTDPYAGGWWAEDDKNITYQATLPAGEYSVILGHKGWWSQSRTMAVTVSAGEDTLTSTTASVTSDTAGYDQTDTFTLDEETVVTINVGKGNSNSILSWLMVCGEPTVEENVIAYFDFDDAAQDGVFTGINALAENKGSVELVERDEKNGSAAKFVMGDSDWLDVTAADGSSLLTGYDEITVSYDIVPTASGSNWVFYAAEDDSSLTWGANGNKEKYLGTLVKNGELQVERYHNTGSRPTVPSVGLTADTWQHIDIVYTKDCTVLYLNGERVSKIDTTYQLTDILGNSSIFQIGKANWGDGEYSTMLLDNFKIVEGTKIYDDDKYAQAVAEIKSALGETDAVTDSLNLIGESSDGLTVAWSSSNRDIVAADGTVTIPDEDTEVTLTAVISEGNTVLGKETYTVTVLAAEATLETLAEQLTLPYKEVYGNITLPDSVGKASVTWTTDQSEIVDVNSHENENYDDTPAGVVTRPEKDTKVTMTATITLNGQSTTKSFDFTVKAAAKEIKESDYTDYFFAYFAGEGYADGEQIYFASSEDGLNWDDLNENNPVLTSTLGEEGVRDPFIIRSPEGDKFYLIATDLKIYNGNGWDAAQNRGSQSLMVWESTDLVNWSDQRMVEVSAEIEAGCTWAPEATYDPVTGEYVVYWASRTPNVDTKQRVYYAKTRDFYTFTEPQVWIDYDQSSIDTSMIYNDGVYYRFTKNEGGSTNSLEALTKTVFMEKSDNVLGTFTPIASASLNANQWVEGPTIFKLNQDDAAEDTWCLLVDEFGGRGYYPLLTTDLSSGEFTVPDEGTYQMPSRARHGTPIRITADEYAAIVAAYGSADEVELVTTIGKVPELPETVSITIKDEQTTVGVTWDEVTEKDFTVNPFTYVTVSGTTETGVKATASVLVIPENLKYMIDCANTGSEIWSALSSGLLNSEAADQPKTEDNSWGYTSVADKDIASYTSLGTSSPYLCGWYAKEDCNISYQMTLPAGEYNFMLGASDSWWGGWGHRKMSVTAVVDDEETTLGTFNLENDKKDAYSVTDNTLVLTEKSVVTITLACTEDSSQPDPIVGWIAVCGEASEQPPVIDYTKLNAQIDAAEKLSADDYTTASYAAVTSALSDAKALLDKADNQGDVDAAAEALENAIIALVEAADFSELRAYYEANKEIEGNYTADSFEAYKTARDEAAAVLENRDAAQDDVDTALQNLKKAVNGLKEIPKVDKTDLQNLYDAYKGTEQGNYTDDSYAELTKALEAAKAVLEDADAAQTEVDDAYTALQNAYGALKEKAPAPVEVDKTKLQDLYALYRGTEQGNYTDDSYAELTKALKAAKAVLEDADAVQDEVTAAYDALRVAYAGLKTAAPAETVNKDNLQKLYDSVKNLKQGNYTKESYAELTKALEAAKAVLEDADATQDEVSAAYSKLYDAVKGLTDGSSDSNKNSNTKTAKTGDTAPIAGFTFAFLAAALAAVLAYRRKRAGR